MLPSRTAALAAALAACTPLTGDLVFTDAHTYAYDGHLDATLHAVAPGTDVLVSWDQLTLDIQGRAIPDPATDVSQIGLVAFNLDMAGVIDAIATNDLLQSNIRDYRLFLNKDEVTQARLSEFSILGNDFVPADDLYEGEGVWQWALTVWSEMIDGTTDIRTVTFLDLVDGGATAEIAFTDDLASLDVTVDLHSNEGLRTGDDLEAYTLDWSAVSVDATDHLLDPSAADTLLVGHIDADDIGDVEARVMELLDAPESLYRLNVVNDTSADLLRATRLDGTPFAGFTRDGTWLVGLECSTCTSPAPVIMTVVEVR